MAGAGASAGQAGSDYADRMAAEHAGDVPVASGLAKAKPATSVSTEVVTYATIDGKPVSGYLARPDNAEIHFHVGFAHYRLGEFQNTTEAFNRALELDPNFPLAAEARTILLELR